jgi:hypothetical protein
MGDLTDKCANPACENDATTAVTLFGQEVGGFYADCNQIVTHRSVDFGLLDKIVAAGSETSIDHDGGVPFEAYMFVDDEDAGLLHRPWDAQRKHTGEVT